VTLEKVINNNKQFSNKWHIIIIQEAQLPQRNSASVVHVYLG